MHRPWSSNQRTPLVSCVQVAIRLPTTGACVSLHRLRSRTPVAIRTPKMRMPFHPTPDSGSRPSRLSQCRACPVTSGFDGFPRLQCLSSRQVVVLAVVVVLVVFAIVSTTGQTFLLRRPRRASVPLTSPLSLLWPRTPSIQLPPYPGPWYGLRAGFACRFV
jgi:hypothetical protein